MSEHGGSAITGYKGAFASEKGNSHKMQKDLAVVSGKVTEISAFPSGQCQGRQDYTAHIPEYRGIPGVAVSDGETVTTTDENGNFTLFIDPDRRKKTIIFITLPEGYSVRVDNTMTPQFFAGFEGLKAGQETERNFVLVPDGGLKGNKGKFIFITDTHVSKYRNKSIDTEKERLILQLKQLNSLADQADFIITGGDFCDGATVEEYSKHKEAAAVSSLMIWPTAGNHDLKDFRNDGCYKSYVENYREFIGPEWYSFNYRGYHIVVLENNRGQKEPDQLKWLKQDLALLPEGKRIIVIAHMPFNSPEARDMEDLEKLLANYPVSLTLTGHQHSNDTDPNIFGKGEHIQTAALWETQDGNPEGFRIISMGDNSEITHRFVAFGIKNRLTILSPEPDRSIPANVPTDIQVNAYDTMNGIKCVYCRVDGGNRRELIQKSPWTWAVESMNRLCFSQGGHHIDVTVEACNGECWQRSCDFTAEWSCLSEGKSCYNGTGDIATPLLRLSWIYNSGGSILASSPVVSDSMVYIGIRDENGVKNYGLCAIDFHTGAEIWRRYVDAPVEATPVIYRDVIYFSGMRGTVYAFSAQTGETVWEHRTGIQKDGIQRAWTQASSALADGVVYQSLGYALLALDAKTGSVLWEFRPDKDPCGNSDRQGAPVVYDEIVYFTGDGRYLTAVSTKTGEELWRHYPSVSSRLRAGAVVSEGIIYMRVEAGHIDALDAKTGRQLWHCPKPISNEGRAHIAVTERMLVYPAGRHLVCADKNSHQEVWSFEAGGDIESSPAISGQTIYFGSKDGFLYAVDLRTGIKLWSYETGTWVNSSPAVWGNKVIVGAYDGNVYCFSGV